MGTTGQLADWLGGAAVSHWGIEHLAPWQKQTVMPDAGLSVKPRFWTGPGWPGQVLPVSRPICSVGSKKNLVSVSHSSVLPEWDSLVVFLRNRVSL